MQLTGSCYAFYALRKEQRVIPAKEKPPDCLVVAFFIILIIFFGYSEPIGAIESIATGGGSVSDTGGGGSGCVGSCGIFK